MDHLSLRRSLPVCIAGVVLVGTVAADQVCYVQILENACGDTSLNTTRHCSGGPSCPDLYFINQPCWHANPVPPPSGGKEAQVIPGSAKCEIVFRVCVGSTCVDDYSLTFTREQTQQYGTCTTQLEG